MAAQAPTSCKREEAAPILHLVRWGPSSLERGLLPREHEGLHPLAPWVPRVVPCHPVPVGFRRHGPGVRRPRDVPDLHEGHHPRWWARLPDAGSQEQERQAHQLPARPHRNPHGGDPHQLALAGGGTLRRSSTGQDRHPCPSQTSHAGPDDPLGRTLVFDTSHDGRAGVR